MLPLPERTLVGADRCVSHGREGNLRCKRSAGGVGPVNENIVRVS